MRFTTALALGRVSNLPTVWTNALAGFLLAGGGMDPALLALLAAVSCFYLGGMYLNDAFDAAWDREMGTGRPIARGEVAVETVYFWGFLLLLSGLALLLPQADRKTLAAALLLTLTILLYDRLHKGLRHAAWLMGGCRLLVYATAGFLAGAPGPLLWSAALAALLHTTGITYLARAEHLDRLEGRGGLLLFAPPLLLPLVSASGNPAPLPFWLLYAGALLLALRLLRRRGPGDVPRAVGLLIAALALLDGAFLAAAGRPVAALAGPAAFAATLLLQRRIAGT